MSEWNRRDRDEGQRRYGYEDRNRQGYGGQDRWGGSARQDDEQRSFGQGGRGGDWRSYEDYQSGGRGYGGSGRGREEDNGRSGQGYSGGWSGADQSYDERDQDGLAYYGLGPFGSGQHPGGGGQYDQGQYGPDRGYRGGRYGQGQGYGGQRTQGQQGYSQGGAMGHNERLERVSDGEGDRHNFFGGGMMRGGEHRGRGPKNYTRSDDRIREDVNDRLSDDSWLDASEIDVAVSSCEVTLTGTVKSREDKRRAEDIAEQVSGVKHVQNNLRVQAQTSPTSAQATQSATQRSDGGQSGSIQ